MKILYISVVSLVLLASLAVYAQEQQPSANPRQNESSQSTAAPANSRENQQTAPPPIKVTTGLVHLVVTVTDKKHNFITDLDRGDFKILENNAPQDIRFF